MSVAALALLDSDNTVLADLTESLSQQLTDFLVVVGRNGSNLLNLVVVVIDALGILLDEVNNALHCLVDTTLQVHRIGTGGHVLQTLGHDSLCQDCCSSRTVAGIVASL